MTTASEEVPFLSGMERETVCEASIEVGKKAFQLDGMLDRLLKKAREALESRMHERGPDPDCADMNSTDRVLIELLREIRRPSYSNGGDESSDIKKWIAGVGAALSLSFIIGGWVLSNQVASLTAKVDAIAEHQRASDERITRIEQNERRP